MAQVTDWVFFLGGRDLEMLEIGLLVRGNLKRKAIVDKRLPWHAAKASAYRNEIAGALAARRRPVLVELQPDLPPEILDRCVLVDHHGPLAGADRPTNLEQVFALLGLPATAWSRRMALVAANDRGWIPELRAAGAIPMEIAAIRAEDRAAQGVAPVDEAAAEAAIDAAETVLAGSLILIRLPHDRTSPVFDRLALSVAQGDLPDALVAGPTEFNFSGRGDRVQALAAAFPGGWYGGALPERGFWGHGSPLPPLEAVLSALQQAQRG